MIISKRNTLIGSKKRRGQKRGAALFDKTIWNTHERLLAGLPRTTNELEGFHNGIRKMAGKSHPALFECVENLQKLRFLLLKSKVIGIMVENQNGEKCIQI